MQFLMMMPLWMVGWAELACSSLPSIAGSWHRPCDLYAPGRSPKAGRLVPHGVGEATFPPALIFLCLASRGLREGGRVFFCAIGAGICPPTPPPP